MHEIDAGDRLGHGMFDLEAGVHLDEVEFTVFIEELDRAGAAITHVGHCIGAYHADPLACIGIEGRRVGFFPDLLVAAL